MTKLPVLHFLSRLIHRFLPFLTRSFYVRLFGYFKRIPPEGILFTLAIAAVSAIPAWALYRKRKLSKGDALRLVFLPSYAALVLIFTVFARERGTVQTVVLLPFASYRQWIVSRDIDLFWEILYNMLMFLPFGFVLNRRIGCGKIVAGGVLFTVLIELLQMYTQTGVCEFDDIFNNTLGVLLGIVLSEAVLRAGKRIQTRLREKKTHSEK